jgi:hypothetical protein
MHAYLSQAAANYWFCSYRLHKPAKMRGGTERAKQNEEAQSLAVIYYNVDEQILSIAPTLTESDRYEDPAEQRQ